MRSSTTKWKSFWFESDLFFEKIHNVDGWKRLRAAYPKLTDDQLLDARDGSLSLEQSLNEPVYGFKKECDGDKTLRDFFKSNGMKQD